MKKVFLTLLALSAAGLVSAQNMVTDMGATHQQSVTLNTGTQGVGAEYRYGLSQSVNLRGGANFLPVNANNVFTVSNFNSTNDLSAKFSSLHLWADFTPFEKAPFLRFVGGAGYFIKANGQLTLNPNDTYKYGDITLTPQEVGVVNMDVKWNGFAPYAGLGLARAFPHRKFNVNVDLGTYYLSQPSTQITGTGILSSNSSQNTQLQKNLAGYRWYPQLQLNFNYKL